MGLLRVRRSMENGRSMNRSNVQEQEADLLVEMPRNTHEDFVLGGAAVQGRVDHVTAL